MRYMILIYSDATAEAAFAGSGKETLDATHAAVFRELTEAGELVDANELSVDDVALVGHHGGAPVTTRGPFTEGTEWVGGYYIVDVAGRDRAIEIAGRFAEVAHSPVEIRRILHEPFTV